MAKADSGPINVMVHPPLLAQPASLDLAGLNNEKIII